MCQLAEDVAIRDALQTHYQDYLNKHFKKSFRMVGHLPKNMELENHFVDPRTNLPIEDPLFVGQVDPLDDEQFVSTPGFVCHFFILSVSKTSVNTPRPRRTRRIFVRQPQAQAQAQPRAHVQHAAPQAPPEAPVAQVQPSNARLHHPQSQGNGVTIPLAEASAVNRVEEDQTDENNTRRSQFGQRIGNMFR